MQIYNIKIPDGTILKIKDTPFSGDRVDIKHDLLNISMIKHSDSCRLSSITYVCFVIQASVIRLTLNQRYIYNCFLDLFGDDVKSNFIKFTFCDGSKPFLLDCLRSEYGMFNEIVQYIESP